MIPFSRRRIPRLRALVTVCVVSLAGSVLQMRAQNSVKDKADHHAADRVKEFAKLPDWSGIWELDAFVGQSDGQQFSAEGTRELKAYAAAMRPSFTPEYQAKFDEIRKKVAAAVAADPDHPPATHDPLCGPPPFPATLSPGMYEWLVTPEEVTYVTTVGAIRHIYTDGRKHPPADELWPTLMGDSIGHWEGETLVIDNTGFNDQSWFDRSGNYHSDALHVTERYTRTDRDHIRYQATIEDPKIFTRPWKIALMLYRDVDPNATLNEFKCVEFSERMLYSDLSGPGAPPETKK